MLPLQAPGSDREKLSLNGGGNGLNCRKRLRQPGASTQNRLINILYCQKRIIFEIKHIFNPAWLHNIKNVDMHAPASSKMSFRGFCSLLLMEKGLLRILLLPHSSSLCQLSSTQSYKTQNPTGFSAQPKNTGGPRGQRDRQPGWMMAF